jgi:hypothetical protein
MDGSVRTLVLVVALTLPACAALHMRADDSTGTMLLKGVARVPVAVVTLGVSEVWHARERTMEAWVGHSASELLMAWGAPEQRVNDGSGTEIWMYSETRSSVTPGTATTTTTGSAYAVGYGDTAYAQGSATAHTTYTPATVQNWRVFRRFQLSNGVVVAYAWQGL